MMLPARTICTAICTTALALICIGCCDNCPKDLTVNVSLAPELKRGAATPAIAVDLIGVSDSEKARLSGYSMTSYWNEGDQIRAAHAADRYEVSLGEKTPAGTLAQSDPKWKLWHERGATTLFVLAYWPRLSADQPGDMDSRRAIIPLESYRWKDKGNIINVTVTDGGLRYSPSPNPAK